MDTPLQIDKGDDVMAPPRWHSFIGIQHANRQYGQQPKHQLTHPRFGHTTNLLHFGLNKKIQERANKKASGKPNLQVYFGQTVIKEIDD